MTLRPAPVKEYVDFDRTKGKEGITESWRQWFADLVGETGIGGGVTHNLLSINHLDTLAGTVITGDTIIGNETPKWARLAKGNRDSILTMGANLPNWIPNSVNVKNYGAVLDGVTDDTVAFQGAIDSLGVLGGTVVYHGKALIDGNLIVRKNVTLTDPLRFVGASTAVSFGDMSALILNPAATITLESGAGIMGSLIYRKGMTFPALTPVDFAGTAITIGGNDCFILNSMILGFYKMIYSFGRPVASTDYSLDRDRMHIQNVQGDNINGIEIINCWDIGRFQNIHLWPFAVYPNAGTYIRNGTGFRFYSGGDWNKVTDCFSWGYKYGYDVNTCNSMTLLSCGADNPPGAHPGSVGFMVNGGATDTRLIACQSAGHMNCGYYINTNAETGLHTQLIGCDSWYTGDHGILLSAGDVSVIGGKFRNVGMGITINTTTGKIFIDQVRFSAISGSPIYFNVSNNKVYVGTNDYGDFTGNPKGGTGTYGIVNVVAAEPLNLPTTGGDFVIVTGNTSFGTLNHGYAGREVKLLFTGSPTLYQHAVTPLSIGEMHLAGGINFVASANVMITLRHNGILWYEVARQQLGGSVAGADTNIQYNDGGVLAGESNLTWNKTTDLLTALTIASRGMSLATLATSGNLLYLNCESAGGTVKLISGNLGGVENFSLDHHGNLSTTGTVDGRDISADLNQAVKTTSSPTFANLAIPNTGVIAMGDDCYFRLENESVIQGRDTGGIMRNFISIGSNNYIYIGATNSTVPVYIGSGSGLANPIYIRVGSADKNIQVDVNGFLKAV